MKLSLMILLLGITLIFVGYSHQLKPTCNQDSHLEFINEGQFNTMVKNNASKIFNQMSNKNTLFT